MAGGTPTMSELRRVLSEARVPGRSKARTREDMIALCESNGLNLCSSQAAVIPDLPMHVIEECVKHAMNKALDALLEARDKQGPRSASVSVIRDMCRSLSNMACTCQAFSRYFGPMATEWRRLLEAFLAAHGGSDAAPLLQAVDADRIFPKDALRLVTTTGCQVCGAERVRKIHWPFMVRCCKPCLYSSTISDYRLAKYYNVRHGALAGLRYSSIVLFSSFPARFYWRTDVCERVSPELAKRIAPPHDLISREHMDLLRKREMWLYETVKAALMRGVDAVSLKKDDEYAGLTLERLKTHSRYFQMRCLAKSKWRPEEVAPRLHDPESDWFRNVLNIAVEYAVNRCHRVVPKWLVKYMADNKLTYTKYKMLTGAEERTHSRVRHLCGMWAYDNASSDAPKIVTQSIFENTIMPKIVHQLEICPI